MESIGDLIDFGSDQHYHTNFDADLLNIDNIAEDEFDNIEDILEEDDIKEMHSEEFTKITLVSKPITEDINYNSCTPIEIPTLNSTNTYNFKLVYNHQEYPVIIDKQSTIDEVKEALVGSGDSITDSGFILADESDNIIDLNNFEIYFETISQSLKLEHKLIVTRDIESNAIINIVGDRMRKIEIQMEPLKHIEAQKAIKVMHEGSNLLKHISEGNPHIRFYQLSDDNIRLIYFSEVKNINQSFIRLSNVVKLQTGQKSMKFKKHPLPKLAHLSFSIYYIDHENNKIKTLDLTGKDEYEYDLWVAGIRALVGHFNGNVISKKELLAHSRVFNNYIKNNKISEATQKVLNHADEYAQTSGLDLLIIRPELSHKEFLK